MFSIKESAKYAWQKFRENLEISLLATLFMLVISYLSGGDKESAGEVLLAIALIIFSLIVRIGYTKIFLRINDGEKPKFADIFSEYKMFWKYLGTSILYPLTVLGGLILLIIPGIFWAVRFSFSPIIVVDTKMGPVASMKESYAITKGNFWKLFLFWIVVGAINLIGLMIFGIGLIVSIPISMLATIYVYRELSKQRAALVQSPAPQTP